MEAIFKEEEIKKYIDDYYSLYFGNDENIIITMKEVFEMGFRTGMVKALYEKHEDEIVCYYQIWQMELVKKEPKGMPFLSYDLLIKSGYDIYPNDYELVYSGNVSDKLMPEIENMSDEQILNRLFYIFNCEHPANYRGRSMSVSDIVAINRNGTKKAYYVDGIGFRDVTNKFL